MKARDIMGTNVITVGPDTPVRDAAAILFKHRISALPVVDKTEKLIGIVSEGDLMRRTEIGTGYRRSWWLELFSRKSNEVFAAEYVKSHGQKVSDVMTCKVISAKPGTSLRKIAVLLETHRIKRVPIVASGKLVGIVSRANLVQAVATLRKDTEPRAATDTAIRKRVMARFRSEPWGKHAVLNVTVQDGVVQLWGVIDTEVEKQAAGVTAELVRGVGTVANNVLVPSAWIKA